MFRYSLTDLLPVPRASTEGWPWSKKETKVGDVVNVSGAGECELIDKTYYWSTWKFTATVRKPVVNSQTGSTVCIIHLKDTNGIPTTKDVKKIIDFIKLCESEEDRIDTLFIRLLKASSGFKKVRPDLHKKIIEGKITSYKQITPKNNYTYFQYDETYNHVSVVSALDSTYSRAADDTVYPYVYLNLTTNKWGYHDLPIEEFVDMGIVDE